MGSWGIGLYQDDSAADLRSMIAILAKLPADGDRILQIILDTWKEPVGLDDNAGPAFWLVIADQFERRAIASSRVFEQALSAIDTGADLRDLEARGAEPRDLKKRAKLLSELAQRFRRPRPLRSEPKRSTPPSLVVQPGEVYRFPTMADQALNPYLSSWEQGGFKGDGFRPDGWGALLIVGVGRAFDWFPWCAASALTVDPTRAPSLEDAIQARFIDAQQRGNYFVPRRTHAKKMRLELLGRLAIDPIKGASALPRDDSPERAVVVGWTFVPEARSWRGPSGNGVLVSDLLVPRST
jgi:hypothetical protein